MGNVEAEIRELEMKIYTLSEQLTQMRRENPPTEVKNYTFRTGEGETTLLQLFGDKEILFAIHNMGQGCRYCTLWADGLNGFLPHLEDRFAVALLSKDDPETQRRFANSRGWRFRMASHGGGDYIREQHIGAADTPDQNKNYPGMVCYVRKGDKVFKKNSTAFGPGDQFCTLYPVLSMAGIGANDWTAQFHYWRRPAKLDDGGENVV